MRKLLALWLWVALVGLVGVAPAYAQADAALCAATVREAFVATGENCANLEDNQVCYGSGTVEAVPRYVTADFAFDTPGTRLDLSRVETISTQPLDPAGTAFGVARLRVVGTANGFDMVMFGNAVATNNVLPALALEMTVNTFVSVQAAATPNSPAVGALVPGDAILGSGRLNPNTGGFEITDETWVRVSTSVGDGWVLASAVTEDYLVTSLPVVSPDEPVLAPMQAFSFIGGGADRPCAEAVDSGLLLEASATGGAALRVNGVALTLAPTTSLFVQTRPNAAMNLYVLEGGMDVNAGEIARSVTAGQVVSVPVDLDGQANGPTSPPSAYGEAAVATLGQVETALPRALVITPGAGTDAATIAGGDRALPTVETAGLLPVSLLGPTGTIPTGGQLSLRFQTQPGVFSHRVDVYGPSGLFFSDDINTATCSGAVCEVVIPYDGVPGEYAVWIQPNLPTRSGPWEGTTFQVASEGTAPALAAAATTSDEVVFGDAGAQATPTAVTAAPAVTEEEAAPPPAVTEEEAAPPASAEAAPAGASPFAADIQARGVVRVGVNGTLPGFSLEQDGTYSGFEIELARALAARLFGEGVAVEFVAVSARQRPTILADGRVDMLLRNTGFEPGRETWGEWTNTFYFVDGQRLIVRADSGIASLNDLAGRTVAVQTGTPAQAALEEAAETIGFTVLPVQGVITDAFAAFTGGQADALSADWTVLAALEATTGTPEAYTVVGDLLTEIPWNVAVPPDETAFLAEVEAALLTAISDGTWQAAYAATLDAPLPESVALLFTPAGGVAAPAVAAEQAAAPATPVPPTTPEPPAEAAEEAAPTALPATGNLPLTGEIPVTIFTAQSQQRIVRITPEGEGFLLELVRNGEVVYSANYQFYEGSGRYENVRNSFEYIEFSDTAGDTSLGCGRPADIRGFFNGAQFEGRVGC